MDDLTNSSYVQPYYTTKMGGRPHRPFLYTAILHNKDGWTTSPTLPIYSHITQQRWMDDLTDPSYIQPYYTTKMGGRPHRPFLYTAILHNKDGWTTSPTLPIYSHTTQQRWVDDLTDPFYIQPYYITKMGGRPHQSFLYTAILYNKDGGDDHTDPPQYSAILHNKDGWTTSPTLPMYSYTI